MRLGCVFWSEKHDIQRLSLRSDKQPCLSISLNSHKTIKSLAKRNFNDLVLKSVTDKQEWLTGCDRTQWYSPTFLQRSSQSFFFKLPFFLCFCLFNKTGQLVLGKLLCCFWWKKYNPIALRYGITIGQYFCGDNIPTLQQLVSMHNIQQRSFQYCNIPSKKCVVIDKKMVDMEFEIGKTFKKLWFESSFISKFKDHKAIKFNFLVCLIFAFRLNDDLISLTTALIFWRSKIADSTCRKIGGKFSQKPQINLGIKNL